MVRVVTLSSFRGKTHFASHIERSEKDQTLKKRIYSEDNSKLSSKDKKKKEKKL